MGVALGVNGGILGPANTPSTSSASGLWTWAEQYRAQRGGSWPPYITPDPYWKFVSLLLHGNGTNGAQNNTFLDSSTNNFTITRNGNTTQGTFTPYGSNWGTYFNSGDYLSIGTTTAFSFGTGDFTVEGWIFPTSDNICMFDARAGVTATPWVLNVGTGTSTYFYDGTSYTSSVGITLNQWNHVAVSRASGTLRIFVNGAQGYSAAHSVNLDRTAGIRIGQVVQTGQNWTGYLSNLRIVKGTAVYTSAFTPSAAPLTAITNTSLLTCQSNRFIDNSVNALAITTSGSPSVQRFSPFSPTAAYSAATIGGSAYLDGSGDYLMTTGAAALAIGTSAFTLEGWCYFINVNTDGAGFGSCAVAADASGDRGVSLFITTSGAWRFRVGRSFAGQFEDFLGTTTLTNGQWYHFKIVRTSTATNDTRIYLNGVQEAVGTSTISLNMQKFAVGIYSPSDTTVAPLNGYVAGVRFTNTAVSSAVPTSPVTAISGTQYLANFTNGGIFDNAMMNDLETVGNAQISTAQSKFGGGSMAFDGTGDYLVAPDNPLWNLGTGDYTIECWLYLNAIGRVNGIWTNGPGSAGSFGFYVNSANKLEAAYYGGATVTGATSLAANTWYHVAVSRSGTTTRVFLNGTQDATNTSSNNNTTQKCVVGNSFTSLSDSPNAYIDDFRLTKGYARYTANFTPPTAPFPDQ